MKLGDQIRKRRRALIPAESIKELALEAGVSELTVGDIERGTTTNPGVETVEAINNALTRLEAQPKKRGLYEDEQPASPPKI